MAPGNWPPNLVPGPTFETPWSASDHHSYPLIPSLGTAAALSTSKVTFSCSVNLPMRSFTLSGIASDTLQNGKFFVLPSFGSHANGSRASPVCRSRRRSNTVMRGENVEAIWVKRGSKCNRYGGLGSLRYGGNIIYRTGEGDGQMTLYDADDVTE